MEGKSNFWKCAIGGVVGLLLLGVVTMFLWNWLVPELFNGPRVTYLQSLGLLTLSKIITWGLWSRGHHAHYGAMGSHESAWKERFRQKVSNMDPAEREAFKQRMKEKWCSWEQQSSSTNPTND